MSELLKLLSANEVVAQVINFLLLLVILKIIAWKKILNLIDERRARIANELKKIENAKAEIAKIEIDYQERMSKIEESAKKKLQEAIAEGRKITDEVRKKAHEEAQDIINNAKDNIRHELAKAKDELKDKVIDLTINATEHIIREKITEENDKQLVKEFLDRLDEV
jgi:F-type H+-transporting ATPase subunit b